MYKLNASDRYATANKNMLTRLDAAGWKIDRFGHAKLVVGCKTYRYKFQARTVRREVQVKHEGEASTAWVRLSTSKYRKHISSA